MNNMVRLILFLLFAVHSAVHAQSSTPVANTASGKQRAAVCFSCHNVDGVARIPGVPNLRGQHRDYLEIALHAYRDGKTRQNPIMNAMAKPLSDSDIVNIAAYFSSVGSEHSDDMVRNDSPTSIAAASVVVHAPVATSPNRSGEAIYTTVCAACHATGAAGAPRTGDKAAWASRLKQSEATLLQHALQGVNVMPPRGGCATCSDTEIKAAVAYLSEKAR